MRSWEGTKQIPTPSCSVDPAFFPFHTSYRSEMPSPNRFRSTSEQVPPAHVPVWAASAKRERPKTKLWFPPPKINSGPQTVTIRRAVSTVNTRRRSLCKLSQLQPFSPGKHTPNTHTRRAGSVLAPLPFCWVPPKEEPKVPQGWSTTDNSDIKYNTVTTSYLLLYYYSNLI